MPIFIFEMKFLITVSDTQSFLRLLGDNSAFFFFPRWRFIGGTQGQNAKGNDTWMWTKSTSGVQGLAAVCC